MRNIINSQQSVTGLVQRYIGSAYDVVLLVSEYLDEIEILAHAIKNGELDDLFDILPKLEDFLNRLTHFASIYYGPLDMEPLARPDGSVSGPGDMYFDTNMGSLRVFNSTQWQNIGSGGSGSSGATVSEIQVAQDYQQEFVLKTFTYTPSTGAMSVYVNGVRLTYYSFAETSSDRVVLTSEARAGDIVELIANLQHPVAGGGSSRANQVSFDPATIGLTSVNVQTAIEEVFGLINAGGLDELNEHLNKLKNAHAATSIHFDSSLALFDTSHNVSDALETVVNELLTVANKAENIEYDDAVTGLGSNLQVAVTELHKADQAHEQSTTAHEAKHIHVKTTTKSTVFQITQNNVQDALEETAIKLKLHEDTGVNVHPASSIAFNPAAGISAVNVQDAILQAKVGGANYIGNIDLTAKAPSPLPSWQNADYAIVAKDGVPHADWAILFPSATAKKGIQYTLPAKVAAGDYIHYDGTIWWYTPAPANSHFFSLTPVKGQNQLATVGGVDDIALTLAGMPGQVAPVLKVLGDTRLEGDLKAIGSLADVYGDVRQDAQAVEFDPTNSPITKTNTQEAVDELATSHYEHKADRTGRHKAITISFDPINSAFTARDVQKALVEVQNRILQRSIDAGVY